MRPCDDNIKRVNRVFKKNFEVRVSGYLCDNFDQPICHCSCDLCFGSAGAMICMSGQVNSNNGVTVTWAKNGGIITALEAKLVSNSHIPH